MSIFTMVAAVLHLGNVEFTATSVKNMDASEVENPGVLRTVAKLLGSLSLKHALRYLFILEQ